MKLLFFAGWAGILLFAFPFLSFSESLKDREAGAEALVLEFRRDFRGALSKYLKDQPPDNLAAENVSEPEEPRLWLQISILNDNFGSAGNDKGLTHGSRLMISKGPSDQAEWSAGWESRLYLEPVFFEEKKALVHVVERNNIFFEKTSALDPDGVYVVWKILAGYTTSDPDHFFPAGAKQQQNWFHDIAHGHSDKIQEYEYDNGAACLNRISEQCKGAREWLTGTEANFRNTCREEGRPPMLDTASALALTLTRPPGSRGMIGCDNFPSTFREGGEFLNAACEKEKSLCKAKTKIHAEGTIGLRKIYRLHEDLCPEAEGAFPACGDSLRLEGGLKFSSIENDSVYFLANAEIPLFQAPFSPLAALSAFGQAKYRQSFSGETAGEQIVGLRLSSKNYHIKLYVKRGDDWEAPFGAFTDDDSILTLSVEIPLS